MIVFIILSLLFGFLTYFSTNSVVVSCIVLGFSLLYLLIFTRSRLKKYKVKTKRYHDCYKFINSFLVSLSIRNTCEAALEVTSENMDEEFKQEAEGLENVTGLEKLTYFTKYFRFHIYELFLNIVGLYEEQGGSILQMSSLIIEQSRSIEDHINKANNLGKRKLIEFSVLWIFSLVILVALRFVLGQFYESIISQLIFQISIGAVFIFIVISLDILIKKITKLEIRGWTNEEL